jgi:serine/threonine protein kinase
VSEADRPTRDIKSVIPALQSDGSPSSILDADATVDASGNATLAPSTFSGAPRTITDSKFMGPYRLIQKLGEGGMGQVWLAEQTAPVRRQVALKLIKAGRYDDDVLKRFQSERQSLAIMDHPSIAKVFDAGSTSDGQPYFVMEYVPGVPITEYCDQKRLRVRERLELFIKVCEGVQHAHQKAIIHRDLKPANIMVVEVDDKPVPRIIDFGLAKATTPQVASEAMFTQVGSFVGTPGYMSPEQADSSVQDIDTRTDVYSLGVVLYVLLSGSPPFDPKKWQKKPLHEVLRQLREDEPPRPSTKIGMEKESSGASAEMRGVQPTQLISLIRGDLDWITMKALEKDRTRRYGSPAELAADITRHLNDEPVMARPASTGYRLQKYIRRHRITVAVGSGLVVLLAGFVVVQGAQLRRTRLERDRANRERDRATRITDFMTGMFKLSDPSEARGNSVTAREILDNASKEIDTGLAKDPETRAQMMYVMGSVYEKLGLYPRAHALEKQSMEIRERELGPGHPDTLESANGFADVLVDEGRYPEAEKLDRETVDTRRRVLGLESPETLRSMNALAHVLREESQFPEAETLERETLDIRRRILGPEHPDTLSSMSALAMTLQYESRYPEAEKLDRETLDLQRRVLGLESPDTLSSMNNLANVLFQERKYPEAEQLQRETLAIQRRVLGPESPDTLASMNNLANVLDQDGRYADAENLHREILEVQRRVLGPEHPSTIVTMLNLSTDLLFEHHYAEAEKLDRETLEIRRRILGPEHPDTLSSMSTLALTLEYERRYPDAEKLYRETADISRRVLGPENPNTSSSTYNLACIVARRGRRDEAISLLREAVDHGLPSFLDLGLDKERDLKLLHGDPRFNALVAHAKERAAAAQQSN